MIFRLESAFCPDNAPLYTLAKSATSGWRRTYTGCISAASWRICTRRHGGYRQVPSRRCDQGCGQPDGGQASITTLPDHRRPRQIPCLSNPETHCSAQRRINQTFPSFSSRSGHGFPLLSRNIFFFRAGPSACLTAPRSDGVERRNNSTETREGRRGSSIEATSLIIFPSVSDSIHRRISFDTLRACHIASSSLKLAEFTNSHHFSVRHLVC